jgi:vesicle-associated membrane protein 7
LVKIVTVILTNGKFLKLQPIGTMNILYAAVAKDKAILVDFSEKHGNFKSITSSIVDHFDIKQKRVSYVYDDDHIFHILVDQEIVYLCLCEKSFGNKLPFLFLVEICNLFKQKFEDSTDYDKFRSELEQEVSFFSNSTEEDNIIQIKEKVESVKDVMISNIDKVLERGEKIDILVERTEDLHESASEFQNSSQRLKSKMKWQYYFILMALAIFLFGFFLFLFFWFK